MKYVAYFRVSTKAQGKSGLGLEAQREAVSRFVAGNPGEFLGEFEEVESGSGDTYRPRLQEALTLVRKTKAVLLIAKLDRLSRNAAFVMSLRDSGVDFLACDLPEATTLTIGLMAVLAQRERELISTRTREALQAAKARGTRLGTARNLTVEAGQKGCRVRIEKAVQKSAQAYAMGKLLRGSGSTYSAIANRLNSLGFTAPKGGPWTTRQVWRILVEQRAAREQGDE